MTLTEQGGPPAQEAGEQRILPENPFLDILRDYNRKEGSGISPVAVVTLDGLQGTGVTSISLTLAEIVRQQTGSIPIVISYERALQEETIGSDNDGDDDSEPVIDKNRLIDAKIAKAMIDPANSGKLLIVEGTRAAIVAKLVTLAAEDMLERNQISHTPKVLTAYFNERFDARASRLQMERHELQMQDGEVYTLITDLYPQVENQEISAISGQVAGEDLYDLYYTTERHSTSELANNIFESRAFQNRILPILRPTAA